MAKPTSKRPITSTGSITATILPLGFGLIFSIIGGSILAGLSAWPIYQWTQAQSWIETPCQIVDSAVESHWSDDGSTYNIAITYAYSHGGEEYTGRRYDFSSGSSSGSESKQAVVDQYPPGSSSVCYVNPALPSQAILTRDFRLYYLVGLFGLPFLLVGLGVLAVTLRASMRKDPVADPIPSPGQSQGGSPLPSLDLKPTQGPLFRFIGILLFTIVWNAFIGLFVRSLYQDFSLFVLAFMTPFVLAGIILIWSVAYYGLALMNPRMRLRLTPGAIPLGGAAQLDWSVSGSADRIKRLHLWLEGVEEATYTIGTDSHTDRNVFEVIPIAESDEPRDFRLGRAEFNIPEFTMHSFKSSHNAIRWKLRVRGEITRWPDLDEEYDIVVLPLPKDR